MCLRTNKRKEENIGIEIFRENNFQTLEVLVAAFKSERKQRSKAAEFYQEITSSSKISSQPVFPSGIKAEYHCPCPNV